MNRSSIRRILLVYSDIPRPETTGLYVRRALDRLLALGEIDEVLHIRPDDIGTMAGKTFDLVMVVDDGLDYPLPTNLGPVVYWAIDSHIDFHRSLVRSRQAGFVFAAQKIGAEQLRREGIASAAWLPLACDPELHAKQATEKRYNVAFVGHLFPGRRTNLLRKIEARFGPVYIGSGIYFKDMAGVYSSAWIVFNCCVNGDLNMRVPEGLCSGSLVMTNDLTGNGQDELFRDGEHLATYGDDDDEALDKIAYYLAHKDVAERIAAAGRVEVLARHTYEHRVREMLKAVSGHSSVVIGNGQATGHGPQPTEEEDSAELGTRSAEQEAEASTPTRGVSTASTNNQGQMTKDESADSNPQSEIRNPKSVPCDRSYFDHARADILSLIPPEARTICEIGCGHGRMGALLKARQPCEVIGIEIDEAAAAVARARLDLVFGGDLEHMEITLWDDYYDVVTLGDVLEHLIDPAGQLTRIRPWIKASGVLIASIPNVRHHSVVAGLLSGNWTYEPAGLLDDTHRHFCCGRDIQKLLEATGYAITSWSAVPGPGYDEWQRAGRPGKVTLGNLSIEAPVEEIQEYFVYQWLVVAKPVEVTGDRLQGTLQGTGDGGQGTGSVGNALRGVPRSGIRENSDDSGVPIDGDAVMPASSLIVHPSSFAPNSNPQSAALPSSPYPLLPSSFFPLPSSFPPLLALMVTFNRLEYTKPALESVLAQDYPDLHIVVWDNGSDKETVEYLTERLRDEPRVRLILSPVNRGVVYPMNEVWFGDHAVFPGARCAELRAKVDNDTVVPAGLFRRLAECHLRSTRFGVLSGFHFRAEGEALVDESLVEVIDGVSVVRQQYVGGCAVMVKKADLDRIGPISCRAQPAAGNTAQQVPFMDSGWTFYQERMAAAGMIHGYPVPLIHVEHLEDTRSPHCVRTAEHQAYKQALRGMSLEQSTEALCVWRPHAVARSQLMVPGGQRGATNNQGQISKVTGDRLQVTDSTRSADFNAVESAELGTRSAEQEADAFALTRSASEVTAAAPLPASPRPPISASGSLPSSPDPLIPSPFPPVTPSQRLKPNAQRLFFTQDFRRDFDQFDFFGPPFAFARFADGERAICMGLPVEGADGWKYSGAPSHDRFREDLLAALRFNDPGYYLGLSDGCCDPAAKEWYLREITVPLSHITFSNLFVNANYSRFRQIDFSGAAIVASEGGDHWVPEDVMNAEFDIDRLVERLLRIDRTILVSAGPASAIIIHRYWRRAKPEQRQVIIDVGSAIDELTKGRKTRKYQVPGTRNAELVCTW